MDRSKLRYVALTLVKAIVALVVVIMLVVPTKIERQELYQVQSNFLFTFESVPYDGSRLFCHAPEARAMKVNETKMLEALNLPNGTKVDESLGKFGECRVKVKELKDNEDLCNCKARVFLIVVIFAGAGAFFINIGQAFYGPWEPTNNCAFFKFFESFTWILIGIVAAVTQFAYSEKITLPNVGQSQFYFQPVVNWCIAFSLALVYAFLSVLEGVCFMNFSQTKKSERCDEVRKVESSHTEAVVYRTHEPEEKGIAHLMQVREACQPNLTVVTITCKTWP